MLSRTSRWAVILAAVVGAAPAAAAPVTVLWPIEDGGNGHAYRYFLDVDPITWEDAAVAARAEVDEGVRGHLVTLTSEAESQFVLAPNPDGGRSPIVSVREAWIGLFQPPGSPEPRDGWRWVTGEPLIYQGWSGMPGGQPDDFDFGPPGDGSENYAAAYFGGVWNDLPNTASGDATPAMRSYVVEFSLSLVPEPSAIVIALAPLGWAACRRVPS